MSGIMIFGQNPQKLRRADSYWGLHFDHHSRWGETQLGKTLTEGMVDSLLRMGRLDYIQVGCKGHPGLSSYPTLVGQQAESFDNDPLSLIRKVTEAHHVALFMHYSGVIDDNYVNLHPDEARLSPDGKGYEPHATMANTSLWGPYVDKLMIPQLKELNDKYHVDGVWVDGDCWALVPDYQPAAKAEFTKKTGITKIPESPKDPGFKDYMEMNRQKFVGYLDHYTNALHTHNPQFQVCSNWAYSAIMPEPVTVKVDFLSGDLTPFNSVNSASWNARCLAKQGKPWDLLSWSSTWNWKLKYPFYNPKTATQLCQEGAEVISMGGGYQVYFHQNADLSFAQTDFDIIKDVADFVIPRKEYCWKAIPVPQIALIYSTAGWKDKTSVIYGDSGLDGIKGVLYALLDGQNTVDVLMTHHITNNLQQYSLVVIPEWEVIEPELKVKLRDYMNNGGNVLVIGAKATRMFDDISRVKEKSITEVSQAYLGYDARFATLNSDLRVIELNEGSHLFGSVYPSRDFRYSEGPFAAISNCGKGKLACVYADLGAAYLTSTSPVIRDFLSGIVRELFPSPLVTIKGSHKVHVVPAMKNGKLMINLINTSGDHANLNYEGFDEIPPLQNIEVSVKLEKKPQSAMLQPEGKKLTVEYIKGKAVFRIPELKIHRVIEIQ